MPTKKKAKNTAKTEPGQQAKPTEELTAEETEAQNPIELLEYHEIAAETMAGDLADNLLQVIHNLQKPWQQLSEFDQRNLVNNIQQRCRHLTNSAVKKIAAFDFPYASIIIEQVVFKDGVKVVGTMPASEAAHMIASKTGQGCVVVLCDPEVFLGVREAERTDPDEPGLDLDDEDADREAAQGDPKPTAQPEDPPRNEDGSVEGFENKTETMSADQLQDELDGVDL